MNFLGMGPMELLLIVVLALIVFGPARLPEIMGQVGKAINDFRRATSELSDEFNRTIQAELQETRAVVEDTKATLSDAKASVYDAHASVQSAIAGVAAPIRIAPPTSEVAPAANGTSAQPYADTSSNGTASVEPAPALAETTQWSWDVAATEAEPAPASETAAPPPSLGETTDTLLQASEPSAEAAAADAAPEAIKPVPPAPSAGAERAVRDDLAPPY